MVARPKRGGRTAAASKSSEGRLDRDYSGEEYREPGEGYNGPEPTKGLYTCKLVDIKDHETSEGSQSIRWTFELVPGSVNKNEESVAGWRDYQYTNDDTTLWREQQIAVALGLVKPGGSLKGTYAALVKRAKECTVRVGVERYIPDDGSDPEYRGRMQAFLPLKDTAKKRRTKQDEDIEDDLDDEPDDDDEDDVEEEPEPPKRRSRRKAEPEPEPEDDDEEDEEDEEGEEEAYDPDELAAELEELSLVALKKRAKNEFGIAIKRGMDADNIIEAILETIDEGEDEEEEPEPEPEPVKARRGGARAANRKRKATSEEPPF